MEFDDQAPLVLERSFAFLDVCGFTSFTSRVGPRASREVLLSFRSLVRGVVTRRGLRVARWVGDGVLLVGLEPDQVAAAAVDVVARVSTSEFDVRAGVDVGGVLLFDGDDYVGVPVNTAARLCDAAGPSEVLATDLASRQLPGWVAPGPAREVVLRGIPGALSVVPLTPAAGVEVPLWQLPLS